MRAVAAALAGLLVVAPLEAGAQPAGAPLAPTSTVPPVATDETSTRAPERVPLDENFPRAERIGIGIVGGVDLLLLAWEFSPLARRAPRWRSPPALDRRLSERLYPGEEGTPWLWGAPDVFGLVVAPAVTAGFYLADSGLFFGRGFGVLGDHNADHELWAFGEALGTTILLTMGSKVAVARLRPSYALGRTARDLRDDHEATLSFFSMHASVSFCFAAFVSRDLGDWLVHGRAADGGASAGIGLGRVAPSVALYGLAALVGLSRVVDQRHYPSDVAIGAAVGGAVGNLVYALHFDRAGRPRRRRPLVVHPTPGGIALRGAF
jgi:membrane-associated phospholipid phosphatase